MSRIKVAVLRGGDSPAYEESLKTGNHVLSLLRNKPDEYEPLDIFISRGGEWHRGGLVEEPHKILRRADVAWNALHGAPGESGELQKLLEAMKVPYTGSGIAASALAHNKEMAKGLYTLHNLPTPGYVALSPDATLEELVSAFRTLLPPVVVKPATGIRGLGVRLARTFEELKERVAESFHHSPKVLVEQYVPGTIVSCAVVEGAKGEDLYALLPTHLETALRRVRPLPAQNRRIEEFAKEAHRALGLRHYSSSDFILTPRGKIWILETNTQPLFHEDSLLSQSLEVSGWQAGDFAEHCLKLALGK